MTELDIRWLSKRQHITKNGHKAINDLSWQQRPVLSRAYPPVHQVSIRDGVCRLAEQHQVGLGVSTVCTETEENQTMLQNKPGRLFVWFEVQLLFLTWQLQGERAGSSPGRRVALVSSRGRRGRTCRWSSCAPSPLPMQTPSCTRRMAPVSCPCERWQRRTYTGRTSSPCLWPTTCSSCGSPGVI